MLDVLRDICRKVRVTFTGAGASIVGGLHFLRLAHFFIDLEGYRIERQK